MRKSTLAAVVCVIIAVGVLGVVMIYPQQTFYGGEEGPSDQGGTYPPIYGRPPDVSVSFSVPDAYLGDYPEATFTVYNPGGACSISYTIFETQPQTGTFSLGEGESQTVTATGPQVRDIGSYFTSVRVTATNSYGSDSAQASTTFSVGVEPFDATLYINEYELRLASANLQQISQTLIGGFTKLLAIFGYEDLVADSFRLLAVSTNTTNAIAQALASRHPGDKELQAKEIYYWVVNWISYDERVGSGLSLEGFIHQAEFPIQTINSRNGICINYALTLATLYEAAGLDAELLLVWNEPLEPGHALVLLHYPNLDYAYYPLGDDRLVLDPTAGSTAGWHFGEYHPQGWEHYDTADV